MSGPSPPSRSPGTIDHEDAPTIADETAPSRSRATAWLRQAGPWLIAAAILAWIFRQVPVSEAWEAAREARLEWFVPASLLAVGYWFVLESRAFAYLFSRMHLPFSWAEARRLRGVTYLFTPINWNVGTAVIILHLRITRKISAWRAGSSMMLYSSFDGLILSALVLLGTLALPPQAEMAELQRGAAIFLLAQAAVLLVLVSSWPRFRWLTWLRERPLVSAFHRAQPRDLLVLGAIRIAYFVGFVAYVAFGAWCFHVELPAAFAFASVPIVMAAGGLPITPAGLGTQQAAMLYFFEPYGSEGAILAFGLAFPVAIILARLLIGLAYASELGALREHWRRRNELDDEVPEAAEAANP